MSISDYIRADVDAFTTEVLGDRDILKIIAIAEKEVATTPKFMNIPVSTLSQVTDALDLLKRYAGAHDGTGDIVELWNWNYEKSRLLASWLLNKFVVHWGSFF